VLFHYTDKVSIKGILKDARIKAKSTRLYKDMHALGESVETSPIVWLTLDPSTEPTLELSLIHCGWPTNMSGNLYRILLPEDFPCLTLQEFSEAAGIDEEWWYWSVKSGRLAGSHYSQWRIVTRDVPRGEWTGVEVMAKGRQWVASSSL
jgi:hypothetical protein